MYLPSTSPEKNQHRLKDSRKYFWKLKDFNDLEDYSGKTNPKIILNDKVHLNSAVISKTYIQCSILKNIQLYNTARYTD